MALDHYNFSVIHAEFLNRLWRNCQLPSRAKQLTVQYSFMYRANKKLVEIYTQVPKPMKVSTSVFSNHGKTCYVCKQITAKCVCLKIHLNV